MTPPPYDLVIAGRRVATPDGVRPAAVAISGDRIAAVLERSAVPAGVPVVDVGDHVVFPGLVDSHAHVNEPGRTEWEGFDTATRAAAAGGITTIVDMPLNSSPVTTTVEALEAKRLHAEGRLWIDCGFWGGVVPQNAGSLGPLLDAGVAGVKAFLVHSGIDEFPRVSEDDLRRAMPALANRGVPLLAHAELDDGRRPSGDPRRYATYLDSRPAAWEVNAIRRLVALCREYGGPVHVVHLSAAEGLESAAAARDAGLPFTIETCPHYLVLAAEEVADGRTEFKCAPPIRGRDNRERLWQGLTDGAIELVVSDHSPCTPALKLPEVGDFLRAWGGIASLQFGLSLVWTEARRRGRSLEDLARWLCHGPARLAGLEDRKGAIASGLDADLVVWDPDATFTVEPGRIHHRHPTTPYLGRTLAGVVETTYLRGRRVFHRGEFLGRPSGRSLLRRA